jgi:hypothetical protein
MQFSYANSSFSSTWRRHTTPPGGVVFSETYRRDLVDRLPLFLSHFLQATSASGWWLCSLRHTFKKMAWCKDRF